MSAKCAHYRAPRRAAPPASATEVDGNGIPATYQHADPFVGPGLVSPAGQCCERRCAARFSYDSHDLP